MNCHRNFALRCFGNHDRIDFTYDFQKIKKCKRHQNRNQYDLYQHQIFRKINEIIFVTIKIKKTAKKWNEQRMKKVGEKG